MRSDDGHDTACAQDEFPSTCLLDGVCRLFEYLGLVPVHERVLSQAAA